MAKHKKQKRTNPAMSKARIETSVQKRQHQFDRLASTIEAWQNPDISETDALQALTEIMRAARGDKLGRRDPVFQRFPKVRDAILTVRGNSAKEQLRKCAEIIRESALGPKPYDELTQAERSKKNAETFAAWRQIEDEAEAKKLVDAFVLGFDGDEGTVRDMFVAYPEVKDKVQAIGASDKTWVQKLRAMTDVFESDVEPTGPAVVAQGKRLWNDIWIKWRSPKMTVQQARANVSEIKRVLDGPDADAALPIFARYPALKAQIKNLYYGPDEIIVQQLAELSHIMEYVAHPERWNHKKEGDGYKVSFADFYKMAHLVQTEDQAKEMVQQIGSEALIAAVNEKKPNGGEGQGVFEGFKEERDAIIESSARDNISWIDRLIDCAVIMRLMMSKTEQRQQQLKSELKIAEADHAKKKELSDLLHALLDAQKNGGWVLQANDCSRLHKLIEAVQGGRAVGIQPQGSKQKEKRDLTFSGEFTPFIVKHNWAAVMAASEGDKEGDVGLPAPRCAFEFRISGFNVIYLVQDPKQEGYKPVLGDSPKTCLIEMASGDWTILDQARDFVAYVDRQFHAACVVIEAQAAKYTLVQAPAALNKKRLSQGKLPLYDFHVIDLNRERKRYVGDRIKSDEPTKRHRLHFVRAHDRHYKDKGTVVRIPWHLRGDPELGFVDKHYTL